MEKKTTERSFLKNEETTSSSIDLPFPRHLYPTNEHKTGSYILIPSIPMKGCTCIYILSYPCREYGNICMDRRICELFWRPYTRGKAGRPGISLLCLPRKRLRRKFKDRHEIYATNFHPRKNRKEVNSLSPASLS